jgi:hypothetical protein
MRACGLLRRGFLPSQLVPLHDRLILQATLWFAKEQGRPFCIRVLVQVWDFNLKRNVTHSQARTCVLHLLETQCSSMCYVVCSHTSGLLRAPAYSQVLSAYPSTFHLTRYCLRPLYVRSATMRSASSHSGQTPSSVPDVWTGARPRITLPW